MFAVGELAQARRKTGGRRLADSYLPRAGCKRIKQLARLLQDLGRVCKATRVPWRTEQTNKQKTNEQILIDNLRCLGSTALQFNLSDWVSWGRVGPETRQGDRRGSEARGGSERLTQFPLQSKTLATPIGPPVAQAAGNREGIVLALLAGRLRIHPTTKTPVGNHVGSFGCKWRGISTSQQGINRGRANHPNSTEDSRTKGCGFSSRYQDTFSNLICSLLTWCLKLQSDLTSCFGQYLIKWKIGH